MCALLLSAVLVCSCRLFGIGRGDAEEPRAPVEEPGDGSDGDGLGGDGSGGDGSDGDGLGGDGSDGDGLGGSNRALSRLTSLTVMPDGTPENGGESGGTYTGGSFNSTKTTYSYATMNPKVQVTAIPARLCSIPLMIPFSLRITRLFGGTWEAPVRPFP